MLHNATQCYTMLHNATQFHLSIRPATTCQEIIHKTSNQLFIPASRIQTPYSVDLKFAMLVVFIVVPLGMLEA